MKTFSAILIVYVLATLALHAQPTSNLIADTTPILLPKVKSSNLLVSNFHWNRKRIQKVYTGTITLENAGTAPITIQSANWADESNGINFTVVGGLNNFAYLTLIPGKVVTFDIEFAPSSTGPQYATIRFVTTTGEFAESVLDGIGIIGHLITEDLDFGMTDVKSQVYNKKKFKIQTATGPYEDSVVIIDLIVASGTIVEIISSPFSSDGFRYNKGQVNFPIVLQPGQTLVFLDSVEFQAQAPGSRTVSLRTVSDAAEEVTSVWTGRGATTSVGDDRFEVSECSFTLSPNPIKRDGGSVEFTLPTRSQAEISIYSPTGEKVVTLVNSTFDGGNYQIRIPVERLSAGVYLVQMLVGKLTMEKSFVVVK